MVYSYSSIATFKQCPAKFKFAYIDKVEVQKLPPSPAMERGLQIHDSIDSFFNRKTEFLHPDIHKNYGQFMHGLRETYEDIRPEFKWGITWEFEPCDYKDPRAMLRGIIDLLILPNDVDENISQYEWKTGGKYIEQHRSQGWTYAVAMITHFPEYSGVDSMVTYLDHTDYDKIYYPSSMMFEYKPALRGQIGRISDCEHYPEMPTFRCKWCPYSRYNGGPCQTG